MVEGVSVRFRWFRTIETDSLTVSLVPSEQWAAVPLTWDKQGQLYESDVTYVPCGRQQTTLIVDGREYPCRSFMVAATTFEIPLYINDGPNDSGKCRTPVTPQCRNSTPLHVDARWSPAISATSYLANGDFAGRYGHSYDDGLSSSRSLDIYEELLASKDREIEQLRLELKQMKLWIVRLEAGSNDSASVHQHQMGRSRETQEISEELEELHKEKRSLEMETEAMTSRIRENEEARESLEWEVSQLRERLSSDDPSEVVQLLEEMKALRAELRTACRKNKELCGEMLKLREENTKLAKEVTAASCAKPSDSFCFSDPESGSTQYKGLPGEAAPAASRSLPSLSSSAPRIQYPVRRAVSLGGRLRLQASPDSGDSLLTDDLVSYGTPKKVGSGMQTDITAVRGHPRLYGESDRNLTSKKERRSSRVAVKLFKDEDSDTEQLLEEAEQFVLQTLGESAMLTKSKTGLDSLEHRTSNRIYSDGRKVKPENLIRPFLPKCASDLQLGHTIRFLGPTGRVTQGKVTYVGCIPDKKGTYVGVEDEKSAAANSLSPGYRTFVGFVDPLNPKPVILIRGAGLRKMLAQLHN